MNIENQVCTLEQAKRFKELGIAQESEFYFRGLHIWHFKEVTDWPNQEQFSELLESGVENHHIFSAYTVAELGLMLPPGYDTMQTTDEGWRCYDTNGEDVKEDYAYVNEAECRAAAIIHLLESNLTTVQEVNNKLSGK